MKNILQKFKYAYFLILFIQSGSLCYYRHFDTKYVYIVREPIQAQKLNDESGKIIPATGLEPGSSA